MIHTGTVRWALVFVAFGGGAAMTGCGPPATIVAGVVTFDGQPVANAILEFIPERGDAPAASVRADGSGGYSARVSPVPFRVAITAQGSTGRKAVMKPGEPPTEIFEPIIPLRYSNPSTSTLRVEPVEKKRTIADFDILSKP